MLGFTFGRHREGDRFTRGDNGEEAEGAEGVASAEDRKFHLEHLEILIPKPQDIQALLAESVSLSDLKGRLESKYPGYTLPDEACVQQLLRNKNANFQTLRRKLNFSGPHFSFLYSDKEGNVVRSERYDESGSSTAMDSSERSMSRVQNFDNIFLVSKSNIQITEGKK